jgi:hypothetical protein
MQVAIMRLDCDVGISCARLRMSRRLTVKIITGVISVNVFPHSQHDTHVDAINISGHSEGSLMHSSKEMCTVDEITVPCEEFTPCQRTGTCSR